MTIYGSGYREDASRPHIVTLDVGGRLFKVLSTTLQKSGKLQQMMDGKSAVFRQSDGSYYLDSDPDTFEHLIRFMRDSAVYPLFWNKQSGFDFDKYNRVRAEAEKYGLS